MANTQILTSKFLSLRGQCWVHGEHGRLLFGASRPKIFSKIIELKDPLGLVVATINPQPWKTRPTWDVSTNSGDFKIKKDIQSFERLYRIETGLFDGAVIEGGDFDRQFRIRYKDKILAQGREQAFSLIAKNVIEVMDGSEHINLLSAVVSIIIAKQKQKQRTGTHRNRKHR